MHAFLGKRIWDLDCLTVDMVLAGSFDWRELANFLSGAGLKLCSSKLDCQDSLYVFQMAHQVCHSENKLSVALEKLIFIRYRDWIEFVRESESEQVYEYACGFKFEKRSKTCGLIWAIATDLREPFSQLVRKLHQRFQMEQIARLGGLA